MLRVMPSNEGFKPGDAPRLQLHNGLVIEYELPRLQGRLHFPFKVKPVEELFAYVHHIGAGIV